MRALAHWSNILQRDLIVVVVIVVVVAVIVDDFLCLVAISKKRTDRRTDRWRHT